MKDYVEKIGSFMDEFRLELRNNTAAVRANTVKLNDLLSCLPDLERWVVDLGVVVADLQQRALVFDGGAWCGSCRGHVPRSLLHSGRWPYRYRSHCAGAAPRVCGPRQCISSPGAGAGRAAGNTPGH
ncbi:uncharacterized protein LOC123404410 isoform X3 [Hordeum vulgare subsp. vulgare]|uniref:Predicted protein n=1 Tax=Hordeum vulgare subsp. vulgare TaxID=112509 RepID=F2EJE0_HORVV|nr:uncharacterized protein LOC123404410 isoform X1 [Hordeum vulgare subsp. vulgare]XP_044954269.1 uncharacterized protein LOC123404410 isoform X2 [Hordeum vulgare subsp. vulgare]XP_044954270.1 uncharacterized protein LOC123404410 isoform X3 [Hordeum vulgare subsp. vulgare]BAK07462.1 predicted protein [Hordeum vulgare subsp. vulgare]